MPLQLEQAVQRHLRLQETVQVYQQFHQQEEVEVVHTLDHHHQLLVDQEVLVVEQLDVLVFQVVLVMLVPLTHLKVMQGVKV
jgi:hypothetical protein